LKLRPSVLVIALEATGEYADAARVAGIGMKRLGASKVTISVATKPAEERKTIAQAIREIGMSHVYFTWMGTEYATPFLTTRALRHGLDPSPLYAPLQIDLAEIARRYLRIGPNTLHETCRALGVRTRQVPAGDEGRPSMEGVRNRCRQDTLAIESLALKLMPLIRTAHRELPSLL
jgi:DNA polymerase elongation subunit (family B)